jgi:AcrR family transcriptional regulator
MMLTVWGAWIAKSKLSGVSEDALTPDRILDTAEEVLRRFGPAKTTVSDVARGLNVSHASLYRYYENKAALRDAVTERWLHRVMVPLEAIVESDEPADTRLYRWIKQLSDFKREKAAGDPELFATYMILAGEAREAAQHHVEELEQHLAHIIADGVKSGLFRSVDPRRAARAVLMATSRFHHPAHSAEWGEPDRDENFEAVWDLVLRGLRESPAAE